MTEGNPDPFSSPLSCTGKRKSRLTRTATRTVNEEKRTGDTTLIAAESKTKKDDPLNELSASWRLSDAIRIL